MPNPFRLFSPAEDSRPIAATVADVIHAYDAAEGALQSPVSISNRRRDWATFIDRFGHVAYNRLRKIDVLDFVRANPRWRSAWTRKRVVASIVRPFSWAAKVDVIDRNPLAGLSLPDGPSGRAMTDAEFRALLRTSDVGFRRVLLFLRYTGCRPGELASLRWEHFDAAKRWLKLPPDEHKTGKRTGKARYITLHPVLFKLLSRMPRTTPHIFANSRGTAWTRRTLDQRLARMRVLAGIDKGAKLYGVRHKFGTDAVRRGIELKAVAELMGHTDSRTTEKHYVHLEGDAEYLQDAIKRAFGKRDD